MTIPARMANAARSMRETPRSHRETVSGDVSSNSAGYGRHANCLPYELDGLTIGHPRASELVRHRRSVQRRHSYPARIAVRTTRTPDDLKTSANRVLSFAS